MTTAQIVQLCCAAVIDPAWFYVKYKYNCVGDPKILIIATAADGVLIALFVNFYYQQYTKNKKAKNDASATKTSTTATTTTSKNKKQKSE